MFFFSSFQWLNSREMKIKYEKIPIGFCLLINYFNFLARPPTESSTLRIMLLFKSTLLMLTPKLAAWPKVPRPTPSVVKSVVWVNLMIVLSVWPRRMVWSPSKLNILLFNGMFDVWKLLPVVWKKLICLLFFFVFVLQDFLS